MIATIFVSSQFAAAAPENALVLVPGAQLRHRSCCHLVEEGATIEHRVDGSATVVSFGAVRHIPPCAYVANKANPNPADPAYIANGYVAVAYLTPGALPFEGAGSFVGKFDIPTLPEAPMSADTTIFLWIGSEGDKGYNVLQPVAQIGPSAAGQAPTNWRLSSWYVGPNHTFYSALADVKEGETVTGSIVRDAQSNEWTIAGSTPSSGPNSIKVAGSYTGNQNYTLYAAMEAYRIERCDQYPWQFGTPFFEMAAATVSGGSFTPQWLPYSYVHACNETVTVHDPSYVNLGWNPQM
jgi:hypothetical protein